MDQRLKLQSLLESLLGTRNVYFQPPPTFKMVYPCIVYQRVATTTNFADDNPYLLNRSYQITLTTSDPDSSTLIKLLRLPKCAHSAHFKSDGLNHDVFNIYF